MKYWLTVSFLLFSIPFLSAQKIARTAAIEDLTFLNQAVVNGHPVNYNPNHQKVTLLPLLQKLNATETDSLTPAEFRLWLNEAIFRIGCVHTRISKIPTKGNQTGMVFFPTSVFIRNGTLVDTLNREIQSINGIPAQQLVDELGYLYASDGATRALSTAVFNRNSSLLLSKYLNYPSQYAIRLDTTSLVLKAVNSPHAAPVASNQYTDTVLFSNASNVFYQTPTVPVLKLTHFSKQDGALFKQAFGYLERNQSKNLILDLRGNLGGNRKSAVLLTQYLLKNAFRYSILQPTLATRQYLNSRGQLYFFLSRLKYNVGHIFLGKKTALGRAFVYRYKPRKNPFQGQIYVLTDGYTASASTMVTSWLKQHSSAFFVGQQSAGGYNGNNGGSFLLMTLPNSKYEISMPAYRLMLDPQSDQAQGIIPDEIIEPAFYEDNTLHRTIGLIQSKR